ncbi:MAG: class I SAM-dependent methyltransferase [Butyrivibrio sp.]|nr:class I SAM-dependent methyltransferase [Muribaculum sp.]MCM1552497.1 class I SAM-dependent methyltransferase [Butyrivibrio sp.]
MSERLRALAELVTPGRVVADVGCDHGFLAIYLVKQGISPRVIASDVREGPLGAARAHVQEWGLSAYIETRLSDGLAGYQPREAETLVCAGMGGRLMQRILTDSPDVVAGFRELILQPQSELWQFRRFLRERGFHVADENILCEDGKYYFFFRVDCGHGALAEGAERPSSVIQPRGAASDGEWERLGDKYGALLLQRRHLVLREYLEKQLKQCQTVRAQLLGGRDIQGGSARLERSLSENEAEIADLETALSLYV